MLKGLIYQMSYIIIKSLIKFIIFFSKLKDLYQLVKVNHQLKYKFIN